jgi:hypothetical protein
MLDLAYNQRSHNGGQLKERIIEVSYEGKFQEFVKNKDGPQCKAIYDYTYNNYYYYIRAWIWRN